MDDEKKRQRAQKKLAEMYGITVPEQTGPLPQNQRAESSREAEAVLLYAKEPERFAEKVCNFCGKRFAVDRGNVAYCSDFCRSKELLGIGIEWRWSKPPSDRWYLRYEGDKLTSEPLVITEKPLQIIKKVLGIADEVRDNSENRDSNSDSIDSIQEFLNSVNL